MSTAAAIAVSDAKAAFAGVRVAEGALCLAASAG
jgi:hypothetical protein